MGFITAVHCVELNKRSGIHIEIELLVLGALLPRTIHYLVVVGTDQMGTALQVCIAIARRKINSRGGGGHSMHSERNKRNIPEIIKIKLNKRDFGA